MDRVIGLDQKRLLHKNLKEGKGEHFREKGLGFASIDLLTLSSPCFLLLLIWETGIGLVNTSWVGLVGVDRLSPNDPLDHLINFDSSTNFLQFKLTAAAPFYINHPRPEIMRT